MAITERPGSTPASKSRGPSVGEILSADRVSPPPTLLERSQMDLGNDPIPVERYTSQAWHDLEVERLWKRVWQVACRADELAAVGDTVVYDVADLSFILVRTGDETIKAYWNACLHRGTKLRHTNGWTPELRCPYHGWSWALEGSLRSIPCKWDFAYLADQDLSLPEVQVGEWNGWVFINPDPDAASLADFLGSIPEHFPWDTTHRTVSAHVSKQLRCNWKTAMEAFMESYHVMATHPQILTMLADASTQYDVFPPEVTGQPTWNRMNTLSGVASPHLANFNDDQVLEALQAYYGLELPRGGEGSTARQALAGALRERMGDTPASFPGEMSDSELIDNILYHVFPNFQPWAGLSPINYRFRPCGNDPDLCIMDVIFLVDADGEPAPPAPVHHLGPDDDWTLAPELGLLAMVFNQDTGNLPHQQKGLRTTQAPGLRLGSYQESRIRAFQTDLARWVGAGDASA